MSNYTESEIIKKAIQILEEHGRMSTTELKEQLQIEMNPTGEDLLINKNRNDTKFDQKVRNMISHRDNNDLLKYCEYKKNGRNGLLTSKSINSQKLDTVDEDKKVAQRKEKKKRYIARKVDFDELNKKNKEIGDLGEEFIFNLEKSSLPKEFSEKVIHVSKDEGDGAGYDILSYNIEGDLRFLEVKTTTGSINAPFYLSENEKAFIEEFKDEVEIVRVYNFDINAKSGDVIRISGSDFLDKVVLTPINYKAKLL